MILCFNERLSHTEGRDLFNGWNPSINTHIKAENSVHFIFSFKVNYMLCLWCGIRIFVVLLLLFFGFTLLFKHSLLKFYLPQGRFPNWWTNAKCKWPCRVLGTDPCAGPGVQPLSLCPRTSDTWMSWHSWKMMIYNWGDHELKDFINSEKNEIRDMCSFSAQILGKSHSLSGLLFLFIHQIGNS